MSPFHGKLAGACGHYKSLRKLGFRRQMLAFRSKDIAMLPTRFLCASLLLLPTAAFANDGYGGLSATGLTFGQTEAVAMQEEDLYIGPYKIKVAYVFQNLTDKDVTGEVIFPLPPIMLAAMMESAYNLPEDIGRENLMNFKAVVDGIEVPVQIDRIAVIEPPWDENAPLSAQYDAPGRDVTADLAALGLPLTLDTEAILAAIQSLNQAQRNEMAAKGLADFYQTEGVAPLPDDIYPTWSIVLRYHWTQTFPAGKQVQIAHEYESHPPGGLFGWEYPVTSDYLMDEKARYCVDDGTSKALVKALTYKDGSDTYTMGVADNISYVLRTANSWAGPIGKFRLTLDKGAAENVISLCADGLKKTGPTTFVMEKANFTPTRDLEILLAKPMHPE